MDRRSLTQRLINFSEGHFSVQVLSQQYGRPQKDECQILKIDMREACLIREVALLCHGKPAVYARSIIPVTTLKGRERQLANLGSKPLGAFLFKHPKMDRGPIEIARFQSQKHASQSGWARRSTFYLDQRPLLVCEFMLPVLLSK